MENIHAVQLTVGNFMGIEEVSIELDKVTVITGENASGKTSIGQAALGVLEKGPDARRLRNGSDEGHVVYTLSNGEKIDLRLRNGKGADKTYRLAPTKAGKDGAARGRAQEAIEELFDVKCANLVELLRADKAQRYKLFLEGMPIELNREELAAILEGVAPVPNGLPALDTLKSVEDAVYKMRADTNLLVADKEATVKTLRATLPPGDMDVTAWQAKIEALTKGLQVAASVKDDAKDAALAIRDRDAACIESEASIIESETTKELSKILADIETRRRVLDDEEREAKAKAVKASDETQIARAERLGDVSEAYKESCRTALAAYQEIESRVNAEGAEARAKMEEAQRVQSTREAIAEAEELLIVRRAKAEKQDRIVKSIRSYRANLLTTVPIPGVEIANGDIAVDGVPFDLVNLQRQTDVMVSLCELQAGPKGLIVIDDAEHFDSKNFAALCERCMTSKSRFIILRVADTPMQVHGFSDPQGLLIAMAEIAPARNGNGAHA